MKGFSTLGCPDLTLDGAVALAGRHGIPTIELRTLRGSPDLPRYFSSAYGTPAGLAARMEHEPVRIGAMSASLRLVGSTDKDRAGFLELAPWADALGVRFIRVFDGGLTGSAGELDEATNSLGWWRTLRASQNWKTEMMIETHDTLVTSAAILAFLQREPGAFILWDAHHTWRKGEEDPVETWHRIKHRVVHLHVKDSVRSSAPPGYAYTLPGLGEFPMGRLIPVLRAEFNGTVSLEWEKYWTPRLGPLESALESAERLGWW